MTAPSGSLTSRRDLTRERRLRDLTRERRLWRCAAVLILCLWTAAAASAQSYTSQADYQRDVAEAGDLIAHPTKPSASVLLGSLKSKWRNAGRGDQFERDSAAAARSLQASQPPKEYSEEERHIANIILGILGVAVLGVLYVFYRIIRSIFRKAPPHPVSTVHGTAHYAPLQADIRDETCLSNGLFLGKSSAPGQAASAPGAPVCSTPEHHTLIVARTRTGKGTRVIVPTLLRYGGSALVIDPKGENAAITAGVRMVRLGQSIHILNPWNELAAFYQSRGFSQATYNPLDILDRTDPNVVAIAQTLAGAICPAPANAKDRFWQGSAANVLTAVFLWLADQPGEQKTLARTREIVSLTRRDFTAKYLTRMAASDGFSGAIREMAAPFIDLADETYSGVMSNLSESTKFLSDPQIKAATAKSSFAMEDLATQKATVYVVIPTERMDTQKTWLRLVIASAMHMFKHPQTRLVSGHRCLFLIDEFAALGRLEDLPRDIATMSGFGVDFALIVQGLDQLKDHYAEAQGTILSNCAYKWFCNVNDLESAKYLSDTLGKATVGTVSTSESITPGSHGVNRGHTISLSETARSLLNPDEVLNLGKDVAIAMQPNGHPHFLRPIDYWSLAEAFLSLKKKHPGLYWNPSLIYDENPYFAGETGGDKSGNAGRTKWATGLINSGK